MINEEEQHTGLILTWEKTIGKELSLGHGDLAMESASKPKSKKLIAEIASIVVVAVVVSSVLFVYYSPNYSWSSSIRDHDGDGVADKRDILPYDSSAWAYGKGKVVLTIASSWADTVHCVMYMDGVKNAQLDIAKASMGTATAHVTWLMGPSNVTVGVSIIVTNPSWIGSYWHFEGNYSVTHNQELPISLTIDDFSWANPPG